MKAEDDIRLAMPHENSHSVVVKVEGRLHNFVTQGLKSKQGRDSTKPSTSSTAKGEKTDNGKLMKNQRIGKEKNMNKAAIFWGRRRTNAGHGQEVA